MSDPLDHLLTLAKAGKRSSASNAERQARRLVISILDNAPGIDGTATRALGELVDIIQANPMSGRDTVREVIR